jgi:hypothetical protein
LFDEQFLDRLREKVLVHVADRDYVDVGQLRKGPDVVAAHAVDPDDGDADAIVCACPRRPAGEQGTQTDRAGLQKSAASHLSVAHRFTHPFVSRIPRPARLPLSYRVPAAR